MFRVLVGASAKAPLHTSQDLQQGAPAPPVGVGVVAGEHEHDLSIRAEDAYDEGVEGVRRLWAHQD